MKGFAKVLILACVLFGCTSERPEAVYVSPAVVDFGSLEEQDQVGGSFKIVNGTARVIEIVNSRLSCGCSKLSLPKRTLEPGEVIDARLEADVSGRFGKQYFDALLITNSSICPTLRLVLQGNLSTKAVKESLFQQLGDFLPQQSVVKKVRFPKAGSTKISATVNDDSFTLSPGLDVGEHWEFEVSGSAPPRSGSFVVVISAVADGDWEELNLEAEGNVRERWDCPTSFALGFLKPNEPTQVAVTLHDRFHGMPIGEEFMVLGGEVISPTKGFRGDVSGLADNSGFIATVNFDGQAEVGAVSQVLTILLRTSLGAEEIKVNFRGTILED